MYSLQNAKWEQSAKDSMKGFRLAVVELGAGWPCDNGDASKSPEN